MDKGWIKLHRSLQAHWLWKDTEPFDKRSAWIDLLMLANFTDLKVMRKGTLRDRKRGEVNTSILWLADRWKWSRAKVKRFLNVLEKDGMITQNSTTDGTTITLENYGVWQDSVTTDVTTDVATDVTADVTTDVATDVTYDKNVEITNKEIIKERQERKIGEIYTDPITGRRRMYTGRSN